jgi:hypothetical protein
MKHPETSAHFNLITRRYNPEDSKLHTRRRKYLKSQKLSISKLYRRRQMLNGEKRKNSFILLLEGND